MLLFDKFSFTIALKYISFKTKEKFISVISTISVIGIALGVAALIIVISVMHGFKDELTKNIIGINGNMNLLPRYQSAINNQDEIHNIIKENSFIKKSNSAILGQAFVISKILKTGCIIRGAEYQSLIEKNNFDIIKTHENQDFATIFNAENNVIIGEKFAKRLGVNVGDKIQIISPNLIPTMFGELPRSKNFTIAAIFKTNIYEYDQMSIIMNMINARSFLGLKENQVNLIEIYTKDNSLYNIDKYSNKLKSQLPFNIYVKTWKDNNIQLIKALEVEKIAMFIILTLIVIVAAFNMLSSLFMLVQDKKQEIAILNTMGASKKQIMLIFMYVGFILGMIGTIIGSAIGILFLYNIENIRLFLEKIFSINLFDPSIYFLKELPSSLYFSDFITIILITIILSIMANIYPALKAAKLNPVDLLKQE